MKLLDVQIHELKVLPSRAAVAQTSKTDPKHPILQAGSELHAQIDSLASKQYAP
jgi:hypothetical protein